MHCRSVATTSSVDGAADAQPPLNGPPSSRPRIGLSRTRANPKADDASPARHPVSAPAIPQPTRRAWPASATPSAQEHLGSQADTLGIGKGFDRLPPPADGSVAMKALPLLVVLFLGCCQEPRERSSPDTDGFHPLTVNAESRDEAEMAAEAAAARHCPTGYLLSPVAPDRQDCDGCGTSVRWSATAVCLPEGPGQTPAIPERELRPPVRP